MSPCSRQAGAAVAMSTSSRAGGGWEGCVPHASPGCQSFSSSELMFRLPRCLGEGSHAEQVSGAGHQLSPSQGLALLWAHGEGLEMLGGQSLPPPQKCPGSLEGAGGALGGQIWP